MREQDSVCAAVCAISLLVACALSSATARAQAPSGDAAQASALAADVNALVSQFAEQRDALGGWPDAVQTVYDRFTQLASQLTTAATAGDVSLAQRRHRAASRLAARISRWLANRFEPRTEAAPARENRDAVAARLVDRLNLVATVAARAGVTLDLTAANAARQQLENVRANGSDAQLRTALRALRDQIDALQDSIPDPTN